MNVILFFLLVLFWGLSFIAIRISIESFPPFMAAGLRIFLGMLIMLIYAKFRNKPNPIKGKQIWQMFGLGIVLFTIPWGCLFWGEQFIHPSVASIINATVPIFVLLFSWMLLPSEKPLLSSTIGVLLGFVGMSYMFGPSIELRSQSNEMMGMLSVFVMALSYALGGTLMKKIPKGTDMVWVFIYQAFAATVTLAMISLLAGEKIVNTEHIARSSLGLIYLSTFSTAIASLIYYHLIFEWGALKAVAVTYLTPFVAVIVDIIVLGIHLKPNEYIGGSMIMVGILLIHWARTKNFHHSVRSLFRKKSQKAT